MPLPTFGRGRGGGAYTGLITEHPLVNNNGEIVLPNGQAAGQTFKGSGNALTALRMAARKAAGASGNATASVYATSGGVPTGAALATSGALSTSVLDTTMNGHKFVFSTPAILTNDTTYGALVAYAGTGEIAIGVDNTGGYADGQTATYDGSFAVVSGSDTGFQALTDGSTTPAFTTTVLMHFDNAVLDEENALVCTASGTSRDTNDTKFGGGCWTMGGGNFRVDGVTDTASSDFTIEWWWHLAGTGARPQTLLRGAADQERVSLLHHTSGGASMLLVVRDSAGTLLTSDVISVTDVVGAWAHVAISYVAADKEIFVAYNGAIVHQEVISDHPGPFDDLYCEESFGGATSRYDELRLITGAALYKTAYTPPSTAFTL